MGKGYNNYMCKKPFHPGSKANIKRAWMAEQKTQNEKSKQDDLKVQYEKEQELYNNRALLSTESKDKLELNFMYEAPPGAKRERQKEDDEPEFKFEWQRKYNAPREDYAKGNSDIKDQPFGIPVRNVRCIKCHKWGHINTDKECPLFSQASTSAMPTTSMDPMELMKQMREDGFGLKENVLGHQLNPKAANQQFIASEESDPEMDFLQSLSASEKKKLLKKLKKLSKKQEKSSNCKKKKSKKSEKSKGHKSKASKKIKESSSDSDSESSDSDSASEEETKKGKSKKSRKRASSESSYTKSESEEESQHSKHKRTKHNEKQRLKTKFEQKSKNKSKTRALSQSSDSESESDRDLKNSKYKRSKQNHERQGSKIKFKEKEKSKTKRSNKRTSSLSSDSESKSDRVLKNSKHKYSKQNDEKQGPTIIKSKEKEKIKTKRSSKRASSLSSDSESESEDKLKHSKHKRLKDSNVIQNSKIKSKEKKENKSKPTKIYSSDSSSAESEYEEVLKSSKQKGKKDDYEKQNLKGELKQKDKKNEKNKVDKYKGDLNISRSDSRRYDKAEKRKVSESERPSYKDKPSHSKNSSFSDNDEEMEKLTRKKRRNSDDNVSKRTEANSSNESEAYQQTDSRSSKSDKNSKDRSFRDQTSKSSSKNQTEENYFSEHKKSQKLPMYNSDDKKCRVFLNEKMQNCDTPSRDNSSKSTQKSQIDEKISEYESPHSKKLSLKDIDNEKRKPLASNIEDLNRIYTPSTSKSPIDEGKRSEHKILCSDNLLLKDNENEKMLPIKTKDLINKACSEKCTPDSTDKCEPQLEVNSNSEESHSKLSLTSSKIEERQTLKKTAENSNESYSVCTQKSPNTCEKENISVLDKTCRKDSESEVQPSKITKDIDNKSSIENVSQSKMNEDMDKNKQHNNTSESISTGTSVSVKNEKHLLKRRSNDESETNCKKVKEEITSILSNCNSPTHPDGFSHNCPQEICKTNYMETVDKYQGELHDNFRDHHRKRRSPSVKQKYHQ